jgi:hypothetical protein
MADEGEAAEVRFSTGPHAEPIWCAPFHRTGVSARAGDGGVAEPVG